MFFCFFYTAIVFNPADTADNLKKYGGFIPGIRPGKRTAEYLDYVLTRLTVVGAGYLALVCLLPEILMSQYAVPFYFGGTSLLIVVSVTMDTVSQIQSHLLAHQYEDEAFVRVHVLNDEQALDEMDEAVYWIHVRCLSLLTADLDHSYW